MSRNCARTANSLLRAARVPLLRPMAPPLVPSDAAVGVVPREGTGGGESTGAGGVLRCSGRPSGNVCSVS